MLKTVTFQQPHLFVFFYKAVRFCLKPLLGVTTILFFISLGN